MDERTSLSRRRLLHTLTATGVIAVADLAWWEEPFLAPRKAWGAEPVRFQWSVPEPTRIALMNSLIERFNQSQKDFAVQIEYVPQAQARQKLISGISGAINDARNKGVSVVDFRDFFPRMGYKVRTDITEDKINQAAARYLSNVIPMTDNPGNN